MDTCRLIIEFEYKKKEKKMERKVNQFYQNDIKSAAARYLGTNVKFIVKFHCSRNCSKRGSKTYFNFFCIQKYEHEIKTMTSNILFKDANVVLNDT